MLKLRPVVEKDKTLIFDWANEAEVRQNAIDTNPIVWESHCQWFEKKCHSQTTIFLIAEQNEKPVGQIRFDRDQDIAVIDYSVDASCRGQGLGAQILKEGCLVVVSLWGQSILIKGEVKPENTASQKAFESAGFKKISDEKLICFEWRG